MAKEKKVCQTCCDFVVHGKSDSVNDIGEHFEYQSEVERAIPSDKYSTEYQSADGGVCDVCSLNVKTRFTIKPKPEFDTTQSSNLLEEGMMSYDEFVDTYKPFPSPTGHSGDYIWDFNETVKRAAEAGRACTVRHGDGDEEDDIWTIDAGIGVVNRIGYMITEVVVPADLIVEY